MPRINPSFIKDRLLPAVSIEKLIGQYVSLKKSGANYMCCCPFHHEKTPSFCVTPSKQMFYCFGCKEHGTAIDFLMKFKNLGFVDAVEELSQFAGIEVEYEAGTYHENSDRYKIYYELMDRCASLFTAELFSSKNAEALAYFTRRRGLNKDTILKARLGFAPAGWNFLQEKLCKSKDEENTLVELGMLVKNEGRIYSMYRNRIMIPIFDRKGRIISFGGRTMGDDKPKYLNTKETPIYRKRNELFGLYEALKANNNRPERLVVCEGYMDVISVRQAGCSYAVASLGTATTAEQFKTMFRSANRVICCYDGDTAGRNAAWHALETVTEALEDGKDIRFAFLPPEHDPDSLVRAQGLKAFTSYLDNAVSYPEFLVSHIAGEYNLSDSGQISTFISQSLRRIQKIPLKPVQSVALTLLSKSCGIEERQLYDMLYDLPKENEKSTASPFAQKLYDDANDSKDLLKTPMRRLIAFVLQQPNIIATVYHDCNLDLLATLFYKLKIKGADEFASLLKAIADDPDMTQAMFIEQSRGSVRENYVRKFIGADLNIKIGDTELSRKQRIDYLVQLLAEVLTEPLRNKAKLLSLRANSSSAKEMNELLTVRKNLKAIDETKR